MDRINGADFVDIGGGRRGFRSEDLPTGVAGTEVTALFLNMVQEEIAAVIEAAGIVLDPADWGQLLKALKRINVKGSLIGVRVYAVAGVFTYVPTAGTNYIDVEVQAGSGGAAGISATNASQTASGSGGGAGAWARKIIQAGFANQPVTVGAPGTGGTPGAVGGNGGASSFGSLVTALGGLGGLPAGPAATTQDYYAAAGSGGSAGTSGDINIPGMAGAAVAVIASIGVPTSRAPSMFAGGPGSGSNSAASPPSTAAKTGEAGRTGIVIITEYA